MALHGVTTVCDFFYLNDGGNDNARAVIAAARALGMRVVLARCFYDWDGAPAMYRETVVQAHNNYLQLHNEFRGARDVLVCPAPHSLHGASEEMIRAGADAARKTGTRWHIHLAEEKYQVDEARKKYGTTPLRAIDKMGLLGDDMVAVHGCWFDADERALLAERGAKLAYNPNSNMFLGDGVTDVVDLVARGARVALGTDGGCSNSRVSVFDEMRACALLQKVGAYGRAGHRRRDLLRDGHGVGRRGARAAGRPAGCRRSAPTSSSSISTIHRCGPSSRWPRTSSTRCRRAPSPTSSSRASRSCAIARSCAWVWPKSASASARSPGIGSASNQAHDLDVPGLRHHVDGPGDARRVAEARQRRQIARQRHRIARDVDDALRRKRRQPGHHVGGAGARRIEDDDVEALARGDQPLDRARRRIGRHLPLRVRRETLAQTRRCRAIAFDGDAGARHRRRGRA